MISTEDSRNASYVVFATFATQTVVTMSNTTLPTIAPKLAEVVAIASAAGGALLFLARRAAPDAG